MQPRLSTIKIAPAQGEQGDDEVAVEKRGNGEGLALPRRVATPRTPQGFKGLH